jgi:hypothetical protein
MDKEKSKKSKKKKTGWVWDVIEFFVNLIPIIIFAFVSIALLSSCKQTTKEQSIELEVNKKMKEYFDDPLKIDNLKRNQILLQNFSDSGRLSSQGKKDGIWIEYNIKKMFDGVPIRVVASNQDTVNVNMTNIVKSIGNYDNGVKIGKWNEFVLDNKTEPFIWKIKSENISLSIGLFD